MTPERWREIEALYHSARQHGIAVLEGREPELRKQVEQLLAKDAPGQILDQPAINLLDELTLLADETQEPASSGAKMISHYEILERLGAGGMGVVYKARDTKLDRWL